MLTPAEVEEYFKSIGLQPMASRGDWRDAKCIFHEDRSRSFTFNVKSGGWKCQAGCGGGGLKEMAEKAGVPFPRKEPERKKAEKVLEKTYDYKDEQGALVFQVCRYKTAKSKTFLQRHPDGAGGWIWKMDGVRTIPYRLPELLAADPGIPVFVVEGEKDVDNLLAQGLTATSNHGGAGKWKPDHAAHLKGRKVVILPDNDAPGRKHAQAVAASLAGLATEIRILELPDLPEKGDVSDWLAAGGTKTALQEAAERAPLWEPKPAEKPQEAKEAAQGRAPFLALGYSEGSYYYLNQETNQVASMTAVGHGKLPLLSLAPKQHWEKAYGSDKGIGWDRAASDMMQACARHGVFDHTRIRGRGAWYDNGRPVVHLGNAVIIGGERRPLGQPEPGGCIYPASVPIPIDYANPLEATQAAQLSALCDLLNWERPISGRLLAGWLAIAPICGALSWRPHIWMTGAAGTGKSWVMDNIMRPILGRIGLFVQSDTTEAGIRQALGYDARPVLFDEAEGESERAQVRMQNVMALMRQSSSENGSVIVKGSASGNVKVYSVRSCFAFSSIGVSIKQHSDSTRVTVLAMVKNDKPDAAERFNTLRAQAIEVLNPDWIAGLHARMISLIPTVRQNAEIFATAAAKKIGSQRMGDQVGALLAGAWALHSDRVITPAEADAWVDKQDWQEQTSIQETPDEVLCLQRLLEHVEIVQSGRGPAKISVGEMIEKADDTQDPGQDVYRGTLLRLGIKVDTDKGEVIIANQSAGIQRIMAGTPWSDWGRILRRIKDSEPTPMPVRFAGGKVRGTIIPLSAIFN